MKLGEHCRVRPRDIPSDGWAVDVYDGRGAWAASHPGPFTQDEALKRAHQVMVRIRRLNDASVRSGERYEWCSLDTSTAVHAVPVVGDGRVSTIARCGVRRRDGRTWVPETAAVYGRHRCSVCERFLRGDERRKEQCLITGQTIQTVNDLCAEAHATALEKGWWDKERSDGELVALMHSELSEALEYLRKPEGLEAPSDHLPGISGVAEEMADVLIRIFDFCGRRNIDLGTALVEKLRYNRGRERRHGGKRM